MIAWQYFPGTTFAVFSDFSDRFTVSQLLNDTKYYVLYSFGPKPSFQLSSAVLLAESMILRERLKNTSFEVQLSEDTFFSNFHFVSR